MQDEYGNEIPAPAGDRVGFCQDCGKPLTAETVRTVGSGVFCEPCLEKRVTAAGQPGAAYAASGSAAGPATPIPPPPASAHLPSPMLAGFLGLIPGVGAMYNGQFAKGIVHLIIFVVLCSLSDNVNGIFGLFAAGWVFYQVFEAYHTAKARLEGLPLPNAFGFNDIGDRMGFGKNWPGSASRPPVYPPPTQWTPNTPPYGGPVPPVPPANWAGYVPPTVFASTPPVVPPVDPAAQPSQASWHASPYQGAPYTAPYAPVDLATAVPPMASVPSRRFPVGAVWLIGLGLLFLLANLDAHVRLSGLWLSSLILAGLSIWMITHRIAQLRRVYSNDLETPAMIASVLRWPPVVLLVLAALFALQAAHLYTLGQTWPFIIIAFGAMLLVERTVGRPPYVAPLAPPPTAWTPAPAVPEDATKGGA